MDPVTHPSPSAAAGLPGPFKYSAFSQDLDAARRQRPLEEIVVLDAGATMARASRLVTSAYNELLVRGGQPGGRRLSPADDRMRRDAAESPSSSCIPARRRPAEAVRARWSGSASSTSEDNPDEVWPRGHMTPQTYLTAPSSHNDFYNAHPGGLAVTVAYNIRMADAYTENYRQMYGLADQPRPAGGSLCVHEYPEGVALPVAG